MHLVTMLPGCYTEIEKEKDIDLDLEEQVSGQMSDKSPPENRDQRLENRSNNIVEKESRQTSRIRVRI